MLATLKDWRSILPACKCCSSSFRTPQGKHANSVHSGIQHTWTARVRVRVRATDATKHRLPLSPCITLYHPASPRRPYQIMFYCSVLHGCHPYSAPSILLTHPPAGPSKYGIWGPSKWVLGFVPTRPSKYESLWPALE